MIGAGVWAQVSHIPTLLARADEIELVGVCRKGADELQGDREFGFPMASEDYRDVLDAGVDVCVVSSPVGLHHDHAIAAMEAGAHVLVEKPVTVEPADAWNLVSRADALDQHVVVAFGWNYLPTFAAAQSLWSMEGVGTVEHVMVHMASGTRELLGRHVAALGGSDRGGGRHPHVDRSGDLRRRVWAGATDPHPGLDARRDRVARRTGLRARLTAGGRSGRAARHVLAPLPGRCDGLGERRVVPQR